MKRLFSILIMTFCLTIGHTQNTTNCDDRCYSSDVLKKPINADNWKVRSISPDFFGTDGVWLWSYGDRGESVSTEFQFKRGKTYCISLEYRLSAVKPKSVPSDASFNILAVNNIVNGSSTTYTSYSANQAILSDRYNNHLSKISSGNFNSYQTLFTANAAFTDILIMPKNSSPGPGANQVNFEVKRLIIKELIDCPCEIEANIKVKQKAQCAYDFYANANSGSSTGIKGYLWDFGNGTTATGKNATHYYTTPGTYLVTLSVYGVTKDGSCCVQQFETKVSVEKECPQECQVNASFIMGKPTAKYTINLINTSTSNGFTSIVGYEWLIDGNVVSTQKDLKNYKGKAKKACLRVYGITKEGECCFDEYCVDLGKIEPTEIKKTQKLKNSKIRNRN